MRKLQTIQNEIAFGLQPTPKDPRDFPLGGVFGGIDIKSVPNIDFIVADPLEIKQQRDVLDDGCTGFSLTSTGEAHEGILLDQGFTFALIKKMQGSWKGWGGDLRSGCKVATKIGFIEQGQNPLDFGGKPRDFIANWNNWPLDVLLPLAQKHRQESYFKIDGPYDTFDNLRAALWQHKDSKNYIYTGSMWRPGWLFAKDGMIPRQPIEGGMGHAFDLVGQAFFKNEPFIVALNSYGKEAGKDGLHFFPREVVNREFTFGSYMFIDMAKEEVKSILRGKGLLVESPIKINDPFENLWEILKRIF